MELEPLLRPRSIAVVGATERPSAGRTLVDSLEQLEFPGKIYLVNPKYAELLGRPCYPSIEVLPEAPDVAALCVGLPHLLPHVRALIARGGKAAVVYEGQFAHGDGPQIEQSLIDLSREAGVRLCGPNCMGVLNVVARSSTFLQSVRAPAHLQGTVGLISQSGSICIALLSDLRRFGFSVIVSSGNESIVRLADYLEFLVEDPTTRVIATFTESVYDPERFVAALDRAADLGKPVVVLKAGRCERSQRAITSHTGGLAGESRLLLEVLKAHRAIPVDDLDEMGELLAACQTPRVPAGRRFGIVTSSGGQAELVLDTAANLGVELPALTPESLAEAARVLGALGGDGNPLDGWGNGDYQTNLPHALAVVDRDPAVDAVIFCSDSIDNPPTGRIERPLEYAQLLADAARAANKPHYLMTTRTGLMHSGQIRLLADCEVPVLSGLRPGLLALDRLARRAMLRAAPRAAPAPELTASLRAATAGLGARRTINEFDAKRLLKMAHVPVSRETLVHSLDEAVGAAAAIGYPVVLKAVSDDLAHKSDLGLVAIELADAGMLAQAWQAMAARIACLEKRVAIQGLLVQEMVRGGLEMFAGITHDGHFGPCLAVGMGGVAVELTRDYALRPLPLREGEVEAMLTELRSAPLLGAIRGAPAADAAAFVACVEALADFALALTDCIAAIDLNPIKLHAAGQGCVAVDAWLELRAREQSTHD